MINGRDTDTASIDRKAGFLKALLAAGRVTQPDMIVNGDFMEMGGYSAMRKLLPFQPDAIFAASDLMAIGAMRAAQEAGLNIPGDVAFVGFDDLPVATLNNIKLTTIRQPITRFGVKAVEVLIDLIENGTQPARRMIFDTELIIREFVWSRKNCR